MITTILRLDVGGQFFATTLGTLTRDPSSKLAKLAYDKWLATPSGVAATTTNNVPSSTPTIFIDRDSAHFRYVLNFLRDGDLAALPNLGCGAAQNATILRELLREAEFYEIKGLQQRIQSILGDHSCSSKCCCHEHDRVHVHNRTSAIDNQRVSHAQNQSTPVGWSPKNGEFVQWTQDGFQEFWRSVMDKVVHRGYVDWLLCRHCDNDYEVRLPELPDVLYGWQNVKNFLLDTTGRLDSYVNEKCVYVAWKNVYCGKDGYLDSVRFVMHVPLAWLKPLELSS